MTKFTSSEVTKAAKDPVVAEALAARGRLLEAFPRTATQYPH